MNKWYECRRCCLSDWDQWSPGRVISFCRELVGQNMGRGGVGCGAVGWADGSVGPIVVLGPAEGSFFLSVGGFGHSVE